MVSCDRYREAELRQALDDVGLRCAVVFRGQGFRDGSEDVRLFRSAVLGGKVHSPRSLLLRSAIGEARVLRDPSGNEKLAKGSQAGRRVRARDAAAAATILAVAQGCRIAARPARSTKWFVA